MADVEPDSVYYKALGNIAIRFAVALLILVLAISSLFCGYELSEWISRQDQPNYCQQAVDLFFDDKDIDVKETYPWLHEPLWKDDPIRLNKYLKSESTGGSPLTI